MRICDGPICRRPGRDHTIEIAMEMSRHPRYAFLHGSNGQRGHLLIRWTPPLLDWALWPLGPLFELAGWGLSTPATRLTGERWLAWPIFRRRPQRALGA